MYKVYEIAYKCSKEPIVSARKHTVLPTIYKNIAPSSNFNRILTAQYTGLVHAHFKRKHALRVPLISVNVYLKKKKRCVLFLATEYCAKESAYFLIYLYM